MARKRSLFINSIKGGPGSGNWGHSGLPGVWGGSRPASSGKRKKQKRLSGEARRVIESSSAIDGPKDAELFIDALVDAPDLSAFNDDERKKILDAIGVLPVDAWFLDPKYEEALIEIAQANVWDEYDGYIGYRFRNAVTEAIDLLRENNRYEDIAKIHPALLSRYLDKNAVMLAYDSEFFYEVIDEDLLRQMYEDGTLGRLVASELEEVGYDGWGVSSLARELVKPENRDLDMPFQELEREMTTDWLFMADWERIETEGNQGGEFYRVWGGGEEYFAKSGDRERAVLSGVAKRVGDVFGVPVEDIAYVEGEILKDLQAVGVDSSRVAKLNGQVIQLTPWVEGENGFHRSVQDIPVEDRQKIGIFDYLIGNVDRHSGNIMIGDDDNYTLIDHGMAFHYGVNRLGSTEWPIWGGITTPYYEEEKLPFGVGALDNIIRNADNLRSSISEADFNGAIDYESAQVTIMEFDERLNDLMMLRKKIDDDGEVAWIDALEFLDGRWFKRSQAIEGGDWWYDDDASKAGREWDESRIRRYPKGDSRGGQFAPKDGRENSSSEGDEFSPQNGGVVESEDGRFRGGKLPHNERVWQGDRYASPDRRPSKILYGELGEDLAMFVLGQIEGVNFYTLNEGINNSPIDVAGDHKAVEVKTGMAYAGPKSQLWRAQIGERGKGEKAMYMAMTSAQKREFNRWKNSEILRRKNDMVAKMSAELGEPINGVTVGIIMTPDMKRADVFMFDGFHISAPWKKFATDDNYLGTYEIRG